jgi:hypothetical protein
MSQHPPAASAAPSRPIRTSQRLWDLDWNQVLPWTIGGVRVEAPPFETAAPFVAEHLPQIFGTQNSGRFLDEAMTEAKRRFANEMDVFLFTDRGTPVGVFLAHPTDWSTYYLRMGFFTTDWRDKRIGSEFLERLCEPLARAGVERLEAEVSPMNSPTIRAFAAQRWLVTSMVSSERWGNLVRYTKFLNQDAEAVFRRQLCLMANDKRAPVGHEKERSKS